jgi:hypothetical protein
MWKVGHSTANCVDLKQKSALSSVNSIIFQIKVIYTNLDLVKNFNQLVIILFKKISKFLVYQTSVHFKVKIYLST